MLILAFDTAMAACSVAVWRDGATLAASREVMARGQAEALMPLIAATMTEAAAEFGALSRIAVTVGPGSFTGVRVALAAARGFGLALGIPVIGATTGEVLARGAAESGTVVGLIDTKRGDFYVEAFASDGTRVADAQALAPTAIPALFARWKPPITLVGDGAATVNLPAARVSERVLPDASLLAEIAAVRTPDPRGPLPLYVQPPAVTVAAS